MNQECTLNPEDKSVLCRRFSVSSKTNQLNICQLTIRDVDDSIHEINLNCNIQLDPNRSCEAGVRQILVDMLDSYNLVWRKCPEDPEDFTDPFMSDEEAEQVKVNLLFVLTGTYPLEIMDVAYCIDESGTCIRSTT